MRWPSTERGSLRLAAAVTGVIAAALSRPTANYSILALPLLGGLAAFLVSEFGLGHGARRSVSASLTVLLGAIVAYLICIAVVAVLYAAVG